MSWLEKLLPPKIQPTDPAERRACSASIPSAGASPAAHRAARRTR